MKQFWVSTDPIGCGHKFWFRLYVYDTIDQLQRAAKRYSHEGDEFWEGAAGCFQPRFTVGVDKKTKGITRTRNTSFLGVMRLCEPYVTREVIIHESVHAGINLVRALTLEYEPDFTKIENEETLAFAVQEISEAILKGLKPRARNRGVIKP